MNEKIHVIKENIKAKILEDVDEHLNELANEMFILERDNKKLEAKNTELCNEIADRKDTLKEFVMRYVAHNTVVTLWEETSVQGGKDEPYYYKYEKLWKGMDWQIICGPDDENYFKAHLDVKKCPFADRKVIKVLGGFEDEIITIDSINLCVEDE